MEKKVKRNEYLKGIQERKKCSVLDAEMDLYRDIQNRRVCLEEQGTVVKLFNRKKK